MTNGVLDLLHLMTKMNRVSAIKRLFSKSNPCAVFWAVISVYINALNRKMILIIGSFNPIGKINIIIPFFTNFYTSSAIIFVSKIIRILTSLSHTLPNFVCSRVRLIMLSKSLSSPARPTVKALITLVVSALKNASAALTSKFKIFSVFVCIHTPLYKDWGRMC